MDIVFLTLHCMDHVYVHKLYVNAAFLLSPENQAVFVTIVKAFSLCTTAFSLLQIKLMACKFSFANQVIKK